MKKSIKKLAAICLTAGITAGLLSGCGSSAKGSGETTAGTEAGDGSQAASGGSKHIGIIFTEAGLGGNSFNDLALEGIKKAAADYGITYDQVEPKSVSDEAIIQEEMASSGEYDLIICVGAEQVDALTATAETYPEQRFALLDATVDLGNVASYSCKEQEGAFLVGAMAALAKEDRISRLLNDGNTIGFIGGVNNPLINHFAAGFKAGAQYVNPDMKVLVDYVGGFNDPTTAKTISSTFVEKGADIIFHAAGASGMGVFQAAEEKGFMAIGVNLNQNTIAPDYIMASMLKKLDSCAYHAIESVVEDTYTGENQVLGLSDGGVDFTVEGSNIAVPEDILAQLDQLREKIIAGELVVPSELN